MGWRAGRVGEERDLLESGFVRFIAADNVAKREKGVREGAERHLASRRGRPNGVRRGSLWPPPVARVICGPGDAVVFGVGEAGESKRRGSQAWEKAPKVLAHTRPFSRPQRCHASICAPTSHLVKPSSFLGGIRFSPAISGSAQTSREGCSRS